LLRLRLVFRVLCDHARRAVPLGIDSRLKLVRTVTQFLVHSISHLLPRIVGPVRPTLTSSLRTDAFVSVGYPTACTILILCMVPFLCCDCLLVEYNTRSQVLCTVVECRDVLSLTTKCFEFPPLSCRRWKLCV